MEMSRVGTSRRDVPDTTARHCTHAPRPRIAGSGFIPLPLRGEEKRA